MPTPTEYIYSISTDFPNHIVNSDKLSLEIRTSTIVTALDHIDTIGDACNIWFKDPLSGGDQTTLTAVVHAHTGAAITGQSITVAIAASKTTVATGYVSTTAAGFREIMGSTYNPVTTNAQRSVTSDSANDTSAGTGARTIRITYFDQTMAGPYTEDITLLGLTIINTVSTTICFIEKIEVLTAGSAGGNVGNITLFSATAGGGFTLGAMSAGDSSTFWCHHYVASTKIARITGVYGNCTGTPGGQLHVRVTTPSVANSSVKTIDPVGRMDPGVQVSLIFTSPIAVYGPARISVLTKADSVAAMSWLAGLNFYEDTQ